jgi:hypothetical protein
LVTKSGRSAPGFQLELQPQQALTVVSAAGGGRSGQHDVAVPAAAFAFVGAHPAAAVAVCAAGDVDAASSP